MGTQAALRASGMHRFIKGKGEDAVSFSARLLGVSRFILPYLMLALWTVVPVEVRAQFSMGPDLPVKLEADQVEFLRDQGVVIARGHVHAEQQGVHIYADVLRFDVVTEHLTADGTVTWQQDNQEVRCEKLEYDLKTKKGRATSVLSSSAPWYFRGDDVLFGPNRIQLNNARFTTCDYPVGYEHYHMTASRIKVNPGKTMVATNVVLYMGRIPVFYLPIFGKNLKDFRIPFQFDAGNSSYLGRYALFTVNYLLTPVNYGSVYVDFYQKKGVGYGIHHEIALNDYSTLSLYGFHVHEKDTKRERWEGRIKGLWALSSKLQGRVEADVPGDGLFSQQYSVSRRDASLVSTQRQYDVSTTWNNRLFNLGLLWRRMETAAYDDPLLRRFDRSAQYAPQVDFNLYPLSVAGIYGPKFDLTANVTRKWLQANGYYQTQGSFGYGLGQTCNLGKAHTLYGRVGLQEAFLDKSNLNLADKGNSRLLSTTETWTGRWLPFLSTTFSHQYNRKLIHLLPADMPLHGVSQNLLSGTINTNISTAITSRTSTSYDLMTKWDKATKRFSYLREELTVTPSRWADLLTVADYSIIAKELKDVSEVVSFKSPEDMWRYRFSLNYMNPDVSNQGVTATATPKTLDVTFDLSVVLFTNYRLSLLEDYDLVKTSIVNRNVAIYRDLHDWEAEFGYSQSVNQAKQLYFKLNLKAFPGRPLTVSDSEMKRWSGYKDQSVGQLGETAAQEFR